jgi:hypothetical protein
MIRSYKSITSREIHKINQYFEWQSRFYDHIIRNKIALYKIQNYIRNNPLKWHRDRNNKLK